MVSLFTKVLLEEKLLLLSQYFNKQTLLVIRQVLTTTYFLYCGAFRIQRDGVAMGSPLIPVIANFVWSYLNSGP
jgi:hypothetical protein